VYGFVEEAKKIEEKNRNYNGHKKPYFTEANFREMAIGWAVTLKQMKQIPGIDTDAVDRHAKLFLPLLKKCFENYEQLMGRKPVNRPDKNHQIVIDLNSDDDADELPQPQHNESDGDDGDEYDLSDDMEDAMQGAGESKFFQPSSRMLPWEDQRGRSVGPKKPSRGGGGFQFRGKGRGGRRGISRKSLGPMTLVYQKEGHQEAVKGQPHPKRVPVLEHNI